nr:hypothetical protein [Tanacetum cinerariifolium]
MSSDSAYSEEPDSPEAAPASPDYVPGPKEPEHAPLSPEFNPGHELPDDEEIIAEDQPYADYTSPTACLQGTLLTRIPKRTLRMVQ